MTIVARASVGRDEHGESEKDEKQGEHEAVLYQCE
jgi:hypothetical protein